MDPNISFKPQDGSLVFNFKSIQFDIRISSLPTENNEMVSLRVFNLKENLNTLMSLGFSQTKLTILTK